MEVINQVLEQEEKQEQKPITTEVSNCLALTVKKEYKLVVVKNIINKGFKVSWKIALSIITINFLNTFL